MGFFRLVSQNLRLAWAVLAATVAPLLGCDFINEVSGYPEQRDCTDHAQCRAYRGVGATCQRGYCATAELFPNCKLHSPNNEPPRPDTIWLGQLQSAEQRSRVEASKLVIELANEITVNAEKNTGDPGTLFGLVACEHEDGDSEEAVAAVKHLAGDLGLPATVGPTTSQATDDAFQALLRGGLDMLLISPSSTSPYLTKADVSHMLWRTAPSDVYQVEAIVEQLKADGVRRAAIVYEGIDIYSDGFRDAFVREFNMVQGKTLRISNLSERDPKREPSAADRVRGAVRDALAFDEGSTSQDTTALLFISSFEKQVATFLKVASKDSDLFDEGYPWLYVPPIGGGSEVLKALRDADNLDIACRLRGYQPVADAGGTVHDHFEMSFERRKKEAGLVEVDDPYAAHTYDATWLLLYAAVWSQATQDGLVTAAGIAQGLQHVSGKDSPTVPLVESRWGSIPATFRAGIESINVVGASGNLDYDDQEEIAGSSAVFEFWYVEPLGSEYVSKRVDGKDHLALLDACLMPNQDEMD